MSNIEKVLLKKCSILRVIFRKGFSSLSNISKRVQFFESNWKEGFHSVSHINRKGSILWVIVFPILESYLRKGKMLRVIFFKNSLNHIEKRFNSLSRIQQKSSIFWVIFKELNLWVVLKKGSILGVLLEKKGLNS